LFTDRFSVTLDYGRSMMTITPCTTKRVLRRKKQQICIKQTGEGIGRGPQPAGQVNLRATEEGKWKRTGE
jgi:hypothetical protein